MMLPGIASELRRTGLKRAAFNPPGCILELKGGRTPTPKPPLTPLPGSSKYTTSTPLPKSLSNTVRQLQLPGRTLSQCSCSRNPPSLQSLPRTPKAAEAQEPDGGHKPPTCSRAEPPRTPTPGLTDRRSPGREQTPGSRSFFTPEFCPGAPAAAAPGGWWQRRGSVTAELPRPGTTAANKGQRRCPRQPRPGEAAGTQRRRRGSPALSSARGRCRTRPRLPGGGSASSSRLHRFARPAAAPTRQARPGTG